MELFLLIRKVKIPVIAAGQGGERAGGVEAHLIDDETDIDESWLDGVDTVGITSGASAPEKLVGRVCDWFRERGVHSVEPFQSVHEDVVFRLPVELRRELALAEGQR